MADNILDTLGKDALDGMKAAVRDGIKEALGGGTIGGGSSGGSSKLPFNEADLKTFAGNVLNASTALLGIPKPGNEVSGSLGRLAGMIPIVGDKLSSFITTLGDAQRDTIKNNAAGIGGNSMFDLNAKTRLLEMTTEDYRNKLKESGNALSGFNMTAQGGSEALLTLGKNVQASDAADGNKSLVKSGMMASDELAKVAILAQYGRTKELESQAAQSEAAESSKKLAKTIYDVSQTTGRSRDAIEAELAERLKQPEIMGAMEQMSEKQRESFIEGQAKMAAHGSTMADLSAKLATGAKLNPDDIKTMMTLGPAAGDMQRAMRMTAMAQTDDQKAQAAQALKLAEAKAAEYQGSKQYTNVMQNATPEIAAKFRQVRSEDTESSRIRAGERQLGTREPGAVQEAQKKESDLRLQGLKRDETTGDIGKDAGQSSQRAVTETQQRLSQSASAMAAALNGLDTRIAKMPAVLDPLNKLLDIVIGKQKPFDTATKDFGDQISKVVDIVSKAVKDIQTATGSSPTPQAPIITHGGRGESAEPESSGSPVTRGGRQHLAEGGVVEPKPGGTDATIGEAGQAEAVIPLDRLNSMIGNKGGASGGEATDTSALVAKAKEALQIIKEHGEGSFDTQIKISDSGNIRLRETFDEHGDKMQSLGDTSARERIAELIKQADALKAADKNTAESRTTEIKKQGDSLANIATTQEASTTSRASRGAKAAMDQLEAMNASFLTTQQKSSDDKILSVQTALKKETSAAKDVKDMSTDELIKRDMANVQNMDNKKTQGTVTANPVNIKMQEMQEQLKAWQSGVTPEKLSSLKAEEAKAKLADKVETMSPADKAHTASKTTESKHEDTTVTLKDLHNDLLELNKSIKMMSAHTEKISDHSAKTAKHAAKSTGNRALV